MRKVNVHEAKTHFSRLLDEVAAGEELVIARAGKPVARLVPYRAKKRRLGLFEGQGEILDGFDELPPEIAAAFEGQ